MALKNTQGLFNDTSRPRVVEQYGCIVMEVEDWIDAINQPQWQRQSKQIYEPGGEPYVLNAKYVFSLNATGTAVGGNGTGMGTYGGV
jgi:aldose 1-epimerase